ncbi:MAG TPA: hypothetical protein VF796_06890, partial [Humisphaera sp.]
SGEVSDNVFAETRPLAGAGRGWAVEVSNAKDVRVVRNLFWQPTVVDANGATQAAIKVDKPKLNKPADQAAVMGVGSLVIADNAATVPYDLVWVHPEYRTQLRSRGSVSAQLVVPPADRAKALAAVDRAR